MRSARGAIAAAVVLAAATALPGAAAGRTVHRVAANCAGPHATVIEQIGQVEVFRPNPRAKIFVCATGHRPRELHPGDCGITTVCRFSPAYLIAGPYVFYAEQIDDRGQLLYTTINRVDPRTGSAHDACWSAGGPNTQLIPDTQDKSMLTDLVARPDGSAAWIYKNAQVTPAIFEVHREDQAGVALVTSSPTIKPGSLALAGSTFYWTNSGIATSSEFTLPKPHG